MKDHFSTLLLAWSAKNPRDLPWKASKNPYFIWLSEIILQQTRVEQGTPYYLKFITAYPTVTDLANAPEDEVLKLWQGLGYYSRARNLHSAAKYIQQALNGVFPETHKEILCLKGVGNYTAAAIASFAFDLPFAVVDGNVYRVLSRYFGIATPIDSTLGKKEFEQLAQQLLDKKNPAQYNQAIMDFGATHCLPKKPKCEDCPFQSNCVAYAQKATNLFPIKSKKIKKTYRYFHYLVFNIEGKIVLEKRAEKDIWQGLYQFPMIENSKLSEQFSDLLDAPIFKLNKSKLKLLKISKPYKQTLTHQYIIANFWEMECSKKIELEENNYIYIDRSAIERYAFPKIIDSYLNDNELYLF